jgi:hypothetical protein
MFKLFVEKQLKNCYLVRVKIVKLFTQLKSLSIIKSGLMGKKDLIVLNNIPNVRFVSTVFLTTNKSIINGFIHNFHNSYYDDYKEFNKEAIK